MATDTQTETSNQYSQLFLEAKASIDKPQERLNDLRLDVDIAWSNYRTAKENLKIANAHLDRAMMAYNIDLMNNQSKDIPGFFTRVNDHEKK